MRVVVTPYNCYYVVLRQLAGHYVVLRQLVDHYVVLRHLQNRYIVLGRLMAVYTMNCCLVLKHSELPCASCPGGTFSALKTKGETNPSAPVFLNCHSSLAIFCNRLNYHTCTISQKEDSLSQESENLCVAESSKMNDLLTELP
jgi:hypothetical protein